MSLIVFCVRGSVGSYGGHSCSNSLVQIPWCLFALCSVREPVGSLLCSCPCAFRKIAGTQLFLRINFYQFSEIWQLVEKLLGVKFVANLTSLFPLDNRIGNNLTYLKERFVTRDICTPFRSLIDFWYV